MTNPEGRRPEGVEREAGKIFPERGSKMEVKKNRWMFFRRLRRETGRWKLLGSAFKRRKLNLHLSFVNDLLFRIVSVLEAIVLVGTLCFFYLFCGCHF